MSATIVVAYDENRVIGKGNDIPWKLPLDMKMFVDRTKDHVLIMGRKTYDSIPDKYRPLKDRMNFVVSKSEEAGSRTESFEGPFYYNSFEEALCFAHAAAIGASNLGLKEREIFIIGGAQIYALALKSPLVDKIIASEVKGKHDGDVFFPELPGMWVRNELSSHEGFNVVEYVKVIATS